MVLLLYSTRGSRWCLFLHRSLHSLSLSIMSYCQFFSSYDHIHLSNDKPDMLASKEKKITMKKLYSHLISHSSATNQPKYVVFLVFSSSCHTFIYVFTNYYLYVVGNVLIRLMNQNVKHLISLLMRFFVLVKVSISLPFPFSEKSNRNIDE